MKRRPLRLLTWNVHGFRSGAYRLTVEPILAALVACDADVVALQEVETRGVGREEPLERLREAFPFQLEATTIPRAASRYGHALLSRLPLHDECTHDVRYGGLELRRVLTACLERPRGRLRLIAAHLDLAPWARVLQVRRIATLTAASPEPVAALGDLNALSARLLRLATHRHLHLVDTPASFPDWRPLLALDRVLCRPRSLVARTRIADLPRGLSDHLPVEVELDW
ncbi:MAG: endonuclease/exonuclease/phosphatase family protein [Steroidobacteraceae bacterium]|jgi:endonuclease/exonuclease/phosphatase family metal-dependent hydrolase|nr:endonuclease/exonuclease/phosphatase family protein [Steroidobacteraceae bacterium]